REARRGMMDAHVATAVAWLGRRLYLIVTLGALVDASGLPFPGRLLLAAAGAMTRAGHGALAGVVALVIGAAMVMDHVWYLAARSGNEGLLRLYRRVTGMSGRGGDPLVDYVMRHAAVAIVLGRFFTVVRALAWPV